MVLLPEHVDFLARFKAFLEGRNGGDMVILPGLQIAVPLHPNGNCPRVPQGAAKVILHFKINQAY